MNVRKRFAGSAILAGALLFALVGCGGSDGDEFLAGLPGDPAFGVGEDQNSGGVLPGDVTQPSDPSTQPVGGGAPDVGWTDPGTGTTAPDSGGTTPDTGAAAPAPAPAPGTAPAPATTVGASGTIGTASAVGVAAWDKQVPVRSRTVMLSAPATLDQADTEYILAQDITAAGTAFTITAHNVTLNLNGRTVTYANSAASGPNYGVNVNGYSLQNIVIANGTIRQGTAASATDNTQRAWHPIYFRADAPGLKVAGMKVEYRTPETSGIWAIWGKDGQIHHSEFNDTGSRIIDRHALITVIKTSRGPGMKIYNNHIVRARQGGIDIGHNSVVHNNEIHVDSHSTNSYGISVFETTGFTIYNNTIRGRGEHPIGIGMVANAKDGKVYNNRIDVQNTRGGAEYGASGSAGMRMTWGTDNVELWNNHITVSAQANLLGAGLDSWGRGLWVGLPGATAKVTFRDNTIIAKNNDGRAKAAAIAVVCGNQSPHLIFRNNLVVSNWANVLLADNYSHGGGYSRFVGNTFRKDDNHSTYRTIRSQYASIPATGYFFSNKYENGATFTNMDMEFHGSAMKEIGLGWLARLTVRDAQNRAVSGATVRIVDNSGAEVFSGTTNADGKATAELLEFLATNRSSYSVAGQFAKDAFGLYGNRIRKNTHTITVEGGGKRVTQVIEITGDMEVGITL